MSSPGPGRFALAARSGAALLVLTAFVACSETEGEPESESSNEPEQRPSETAWRAVDEDFSEIRTLMRKRAAAVLSGDRQRFLSTVDPADADLREQQATFFANLRALPVSSISYGVSDFGVEAEEVAGDDPVLAPLMYEHVGLEGVFERPVTNVAKATFVRRGNRWLLGAESSPEEESAFGAPQSRPWFGERIDVAAAAADDIVVVTDHDGEVAARELLAGVRRDLSDVRSALSGAPESPVLVDATSNGFVDRTNTLSDEEAGAQMSTVWAMDKLGENAVGPAGHVVKLNPDLVDRIVVDRGTMRHELTHLVLRDYLGEAPLWATEGIAEYVGAGAPLSAASLTEETYDQVMSMPPELVGSGSWGLDPAADYLTGRAAVQVLVDARGVPAFLDLLHDYGRLRVADVYGDSLSARLLREHYGLTERELAERAWALIRATRP